MRKWKRLSYHKHTNAEKFSVFPTMLDTQTIIVPFVHFYKQIHLPACQKLSFRNSSLSVLISDKWF